MKHYFNLIPVIGLIVLVFGEQQFNPECLNRPNNRTTKECCKAPRVIPPRDQFANCLQKFPASRPTPGSFPTNHNCFAQCMFEEQGIMMEGIVSKDALSSKMIAMAGSIAELGSVAKHVVESCYQKVSALGVQKDSLGCSMMAGSFLDCVPSTMFTHCLSLFWIADIECEQLKAHLKKGCPIMTLAKPVAH